VRLAARGAREGGSGVEPVGDPDEAARLRRQAREVVLEAAFGALALTGLVLLVPPLG
jgi:hypothetical protein